jgi:hypothetical protein
MHALPEKHKENLDVSSDGPSSGDEFFNLFYRLDYAVPRKCGRFIMTMMIMTMMITSYLKKYSKK